jgi:hypothetical protein
MYKNDISAQKFKNKIKDKKVYLKIHSSDNVNIYAFCDPELVGKTLKSAKLTFYVNPHFYGPEGAELIPLSQALNLLNNHINSNIVGRLAYYSVQVGIANKHSILWIRDEINNVKIPHLITMKI